MNGDLCEKAWFIVDDKFVKYKGLNVIIMCALYGFSFGSVYVRYGIQTL